MQLDPVLQSLHGRVSKAHGGLILLAKLRRLLGSFRVHRHSASLFLEGREGAWRSEPQSNDVGDRPEGGEIRPVGRLSLV